MEVGLFQGSMRRLSFCQPGHKAHTVTSARPGVKQTGVGETLFCPAIDA